MRIDWKKLVFSFLLILLIFTLKSGRVYGTEYGQPETKILFQVNDEKFEVIAKMPYTQNNVILENVSYNDVHLRVEVLSVEGGCEIQKSIPGFSRSLDENNNLLVYVWVFQESTYMDKPYYTASEKVYTLPFRGKWPYSLVWEGIVTLPSFPATIYTPLVFSCVRGYAYAGVLKALTLPDVTAKIDRGETKTLDNLTVTRDMWENCSFPIFESFKVYSVGSPPSTKKVFYRYNFNVPGAFDNCGWGEFINHSQVINPRTISYEGFRKVGECKTLPGLEAMRPGNNKISFQVWFEDPFEGLPRRKVKILDSLDWVIEVQDWSAKLSLSTDKLIVHGGETSVISGKYMFNNAPVTDKELYFDFYTKGERVSFYTKTDTNGTFKCKIDWNRGEAQLPCKGVPLSIAPGLYTIDVKPALADPFKASCRYTRLNILVDPIESITFTPDPAPPGEKVKVKIKLIPDALSPEAPKISNISLYLPAISPQELCSCQVSGIGECECNITTPSDEGTYAYLIEIKGYNYYVWKNLVVKTVPKCSPSCLTLQEKVKAAIGGNCSNQKYDPIADVNKDGVVDMRDDTLVGKNCQNESWCQSMSKNTTNPCTPVCAASCNNLLERMRSLFGATCNSPNYNPVADVNKDKIIDVNDIVLVARKCNDDAYCQAVLKNTTNPCAGGGGGPSAQIKLTCSECSVGKTCECSLSGCSSGLWVITSKEKALTMPIVSDIPPTTITYQPVKGGTVKVLAVCFEPEVSINRMEVNVKSGMLSCPDTCYTSSECTCSVQGCNSGIFIATGKPLDSPVVEDVAGSFSTSFTPSREGIIRATAVCFEPTVKVERSSINVVKK